MSLLLASLADDPMMIVECLATAFAGCYVAKLAFLTGRIELKDGAAEQSSIISSLEKGSQESGRHERCIHKKGMARNTMAGVGSLISEPKRSLRRQRRRSVLST